MKAFAIAVVIALSSVTTGAIAAPIDSGSFTVHGVFGGNDYGR